LRLLENKVVEAPLTGRLDALADVLGSVVAALDTVWPSVETFYASFNDEQKARLVALYSPRVERNATR